MRRAALRSALSVKAENEAIVLVDELSLDAPKTREMKAFVQALGADSSALVLLPGRDENIEKSARNLRDVKALHANYLNIRDLLGYDKIVMPLAALDVITNYLSAEEDAFEDTLEEVEESGEEA